MSINWVFGHNGTERAEHWVRHRIPNSSVPGGSGRAQWELGEGEMLYETIHPCKNDSGQLGRHPQRNGRRCPASCSFPMLPLRLRSVPVTFIVSVGLACLIGSRFLPFLRLVG